MSKLKWSPWKLKTLFRFWPPFFGANIRITKLSPDFREIETKMKLTKLNSNFVGTHYGGSMFSMTDPFYMIMLIRILGSDYMVWDKSSSIDFKKPGTTEISAVFRISDEKLEEIIEKTKDGSPYFAKFCTDVLDTNNSVVASVNKTIYIRKKKKAP